MTAVWFNPNNRKDPSRSAHLTVADWDAFVHLVLKAKSRLEVATQQADAAVERRGR